MSLFVIESRTVWFRCEYSSMTGSAKLTLFANASNNPGALSMAENERKMSGIKAKLLFQSILKGSGKFSYELIS